MSQTYNNVPCTVIIHDCAEEITTMEQMVIVEKSEVLDFWDDELSY
jgi:hypothetical protein